MVYLCIDMGKTKTRIGILGDSTENIWAYATKEVADESSKGYLDGLINVLNEMLSESDYTLPDVDSIGLASPGEVYPDSGEAYFPLEGVESPAEFRRFGDLYVINDASLGAIGEYMYGNHETENLIYITISTGIGAGYIVDGALVEGMNNNAGQVGHIKLSDCNIPCKWCDGIGHWMICSGAQLPQLASAVADCQVNDASELFEKFKLGDDAAAKVINTMNRYNAEAITQLVNILNPEVVILGGSVALNNPETVIDGIETNLGQGCMNEVPHLALSQTGDNAIMEGLRAVCSGEFDYLTLR